MRSESRRALETEFLVEPLAVPGVGTLSPEAGFCDGCSGCKSKVGSASRLLEVTADSGGDDFLVQLLPMPSTGSETPEGWCSGCKGCSAACRSSGH